jgi:hypothetical protein
MQKNNRGRANKDMNKVISREYVEKNYIHKDKIRNTLKQLLEMRSKENVYAWQFEDMLLNLLQEETKDAN